MLGQQRVDNRAMLQASNAIVPAVGALESPRRLRQRVAVGGPRRCPRWTTGADVHRCFGMLRALEQAWGRDPNTMIPDVRFTPKPHDAPGGPLVERGE